MQCIPKFLVMIRNKLFLLIIISILLFIGIYFYFYKSKNNTIIEVTKNIPEKINISPNIENNLLITYVLNPKKQTLKFYWKDEKQKHFKSINNLKNWLETKNQDLEFAANAGMYKADYSPNGLFIENQIRKALLDTTSGQGNFYLKPNGVFYLTTENNAFICTTNTFIEKENNNGNIKYATQSGPMLIIDGQIHSEFKEKSKNLNIRNGVGILPNNEIIFAMSKEKINFYDFANYFKSLGCKNALYLDGSVSRTYLPEKNWLQTDGDFGVIFGVSSQKDKSKILK